MVSTSTKHTEFLCFGNARFAVMPVCREALRLHGLEVGERAMALPIAFGEPWLKRASLDDFIELVIELAWAHRRWKPDQQAALHQSHWASWGRTDARVQLDCIPVIPSNLDARAPFVQDRPAIPVGIQFMYPFAQSAALAARHFGKLQLRIARQFAEAGTACRIDGTLISRPVPGAKFF